MSIPSAVRLGSRPAQQVNRGTSWFFLEPPFAGMTAEALLGHFENRRAPNFFPLQQGKAKHVAEADRVLGGLFECNNELHVLADGFDWLANPSCDQEWLILLHKFYFSRDLALAFDFTQDERYARKWVQLVDAWIDQTPESAQDSQVTGRRLQQWIAALPYFLRRRAGLPLPFLLRLLASIQAQSLHLSRHLTAEGNHRTIELSALFQVSVYLPELKGSAELLAFARSALLNNLRSDLLDDGVQKELSTDYHHTVLKNFLRVRELAALNGIDMGAEYDELMVKALAFSVYAHKPDGWLPAINDGDVNSYLALMRKACRYYPQEELLYAVTQGREGQPPQQRSRLFASSGYAILRSDWTELPYRDGRYFFFDCGPLGFGSHGHYDLLSFEMAAYGQSLIVDPGRYTYFDDEGSSAVNWRHYFKGTAAHNTVRVDGLDQIAYQCENPVGPQPQAQLLAFVSDAGFDFVQGQACSPQYACRHQRSVFFAESCYWIVTDVLEAEGRHRYEQFFHLGVLAQGRTRQMDSEGGRGFVSPHLLVLQPQRDGIACAVESGFVSPEYGIKQAAPVVRYSADATGTTAFQTVLFPYPAVAPPLQVLAVPVTTSELAIHGGYALRLQIGEGEECRDDLYFVDHGASGCEFNLADIVCRTRVLFLRRGPTGEILSLRCVAVQSLWIGGECLLDSPRKPLRISFSKGSDGAFNAADISRYVSGDDTTVGVQPW